MALLGVSYLGVGYKVHINTHRPLKYALPVLSDMLKIPMYQLRLACGGHILDVDKTPRELGLTTASEVTAGRATELTEALGAMYKLVLQLRKQLAVAEQQLKGGSESELRREVAALRQQLLFGADAVDFELL